MQTLGALPQPTIAKVQGIATAAGVQLAATCDLVYSSTTARFATPGNACFVDFFVCSYSTVVINCVV